MNHPAADNSSDATRRPIRMIGVVADLLVVLIKQRVTNLVIRWAIRVSLSVVIDVPPENPIAVAHCRRDGFEARGPHHEWPYQSVVRLMFFDSNSD